MWTVVKSKNYMFRQNTVYFSKEDMVEIRKHCTEEQVSSLTNGRWKTNDPRSRKNQVHTLDLGRAGELAAAIVVKKAVANDPNMCHWKVGDPSFTWRGEGEYDKGDIPIDTDEGRVWIEVKTTTNRKGAHNRTNVNRVAREFGYTFQRLIWNKWKKKMVLTPTFNKRSPYYERANKRLLVGCIATYLKNGGCAVTVSSNVFLMPVSKCNWQKLMIYGKGEGGLKMVHRDPQCI